MSKLPIGGSGGSSIVGGAGGAAIGFKIGEIIGELGELEQKARGRNEDAHDVNWPVIPPENIRMGGVVGGNREAAGFGRGPQFLPPLSSGESKFDPESPPPVTPTPSAGREHQIARRRDAFRRARERLEREPRAQDIDYMDVNFYDPAHEQFNDDDYHDLQGEDFFDLPNEELPGEPRRRSRLGLTAVGLGISALEGAKAGARWLRDNPFTNVENPKFDYPSIPQNPPSDLDPSTDPLPPPSDVPVDTRVRSSSGWIPSRNYNTPVNVTNSQTCGNNAYCRC